jgi:hypothetical protein
VKLDCVNNFAPKGVDDLLGCSAGVDERFRSAGVEDRIEVENTDDVRLRVDKTADDDRCGDRCGEAICTCSVFREREEDIRSNKLCAHNMRIGAGI